MWEKSRTMTKVLSGNTHGGKTLTSSNAGMGTPATTCSRTWGYSGRTAIHFTPTHRSHNRKRA